MSYLFTNRVSTNTDPIEVVAISMNGGRIHIFHTNRGDLSDADAHNKLNHGEKFIVKVKDRTIDLDKNFFNSDYTKLSELHKEIVDALPNRHNIER